MNIDFLRKLIEIYIKFKWEDDIRAIKLKWLISGIGLGLEYFLAFDENIFDSTF